MKSRGWESAWVVIVWTLILALPSVAGAELRVVATTGDLAAMARVILEDDGVVETLVRPAEDPHFVDPRPSFARHLNRADLVVFVGLDLEIGWLPVLISRSRNSGIQAGEAGHFDASAFIQPTDVSTGRVDRTMGDVHPGGNPHYTTDPRQMARVALAFGRTLGELRPAMAEEFRERSREFARDCIRFAQEWEEKFDEIPEEHRRFISYHKSWTYVASWLSLEDVTQIEPRPGVPPNPRHIAHVVEVIEARKVGVILQLEYYPRTTANTLAERTGVQVIQVPAQTRDDQTYFEHLEEIIRPLYEAMKALSS
jgi:zinc/manganese transport system substrate-binding protein